MTRFGYAHGWRMAEVLRSGFPWENDQEWRIAGGRPHRLLGLVLFEPGTAGSPGNGLPPPFAEVCWTLCGFASGYLSCCNGREILCVEERCAGKGDALCTMVGRAPSTAAATGS